MNLLGTRKPAPRRPKAWDVPMLHPVTGSLQWTLRAYSKRDALAEQARNVRPDRAPGELRPVFGGAGR